MLQIQGQTASIGHSVTLSSSQESRDPTVVPAYSIVVSREKNTDSKISSGRFSLEQKRLSRARMRWSSSLSRHARRSVRADARVDPWRVGLALNPEKRPQAAWRS